MRILKIFLNPEFIKCFPGFYYYFLNSGESVKLIWHSVILFLTLKKKAE